MDGDEDDAGESHYNGTDMTKFTTEDIVIGIVASVGVVVLLALFAYVVRQIMVRKD